MFYDSLFKLMVGSACYYKDIHLRLKKGDTEEKAFYFDLFVQGLH